MSTVAYLVANDGTINMVYGGKTHSISNNHVNYVKIIDLLKSGVYSDLDRLLDVSATIKEFSSGKVTVINGSVYYNGKEIINALSNRIVKMVQDDLPFKHLVMFMENLLQNPSRTAVQELYLFLEQNMLPITEDGYFLAYRKVQDNYMSYHANPDGTYNRNMVGDVVNQERNKVDDNRNNTCSNGLHFCSLEYIPNYYGGNGRVMIVKINPKDVVSIPSDYNNSKGRCCSYEVIAEHTDTNKEYKEYTDSVITNADGSEYVCDGYYCDDCSGELDEDGYCPICDPEDDYVNEVVTPSYHNVRDSKGRFVKKS
jgi:hypothetical protein